MLICLAVVVLHYLHSWLHLTDTKCENNACLFCLYHTYQIGHCPHCDSLSWIIWIPKHFRIIKTKKKKPHTHQNLEHKLTQEKTGISENKFHKPNKWLLNVFQISYLNKQPLSSKDKIYIIQWLICHLYLFLLSFKWNFFQNFKYSFVSFWFSCLLNAVLKFHF